MTSTYLVPSADLETARPAHLAWLDELETTGVVAGAGRQDPPVGGIVLLDVATRDEAEAIMATDPYVLSGVATYAATGWLPTRGRLAPTAD